MRAGSAPTPRREHGHRAGTPVRPKPADGVRTAGCTPVPGGGGCGFRPKRRTTNNWCLFAGAAAILLAAPGPRCRALGAHCPGFCPGSLPGSPCPGLCPGLPSRDSLPGTPFPGLPARGSLPGTARPREAEKVEPCPNESLPKENY